MKAFEYKGLDRSGRRCRGLVDAVNVKDARERLARQGVLAENVDPVGAGFGRLNAGERAVFYREIASLLKSGMTQERALDMLLQAPGDSQRALAIAVLRDRIKEGSSLAAALPALGSGVTAFETALVETGEKSGGVEQAMEQLAVFLEEQDKLKDRVQSALIYPSIVVGLGICVAIVMLGLLLPKTQDLLKGSTAPLPVLTRFMMAMGAVVMRWGPLALAVVLAVVVYVRYRLRRDAAWRLGFDRRMFGVPLVGHGYALLAGCRFARTLSVLIQGGVSLIDGLVHAGRATGSAWIADLAEKEADAVRHGANLSDAVARIPPLSVTLPGYIKVGEASGGMDRLLAGAADRLQAQWDKLVARGLNLLEPVLILAIGGFVLLVTLSVLLPILSFTRMVGK